MELILDHVALLVADIERAVQTCRQVTAEVGEISDFVDEGTRECYVGAPNDSGRLLLMQAVGPGPYQNALRRRGSGIHHLAYRVKGLSGLDARLARLGWNRMAHAHLRTPWYARSECVLLEIIEADGDDFGQVSTAFTSGIRLAQEVEAYAPLMAGRCRIESCPSGQALHIDGRWLSAREF